MSSARKAAATGTTLAVPRNADSASAAGAFAALVPNAASAGPGCAHAGNPSAKPTVTLQKDGDRVTHIRVQCGCGEVIELECAY